MTRWCLSLPLLLFAACGDGDGGEVVDVAAACDRLEELGNAILGVADANSAAEVRDAVQAPLDAFSAAATSSGDDRLAELARTADESFSEYVDGSGIDAREAGSEADIALDRSVERCTQLGATNSFPTQP
jgi:primase-polymerase (primpol)-like protein